MADKEFIVQLVEKISCFLLRLADLRVIATKDYHIQGSHDISFFFDGKTCLHSEFITRILKDGVPSSKHVTHIQALKIFDETKSCIQDFDCIVKDLKKISIFNHSSATFGLYFNTNTWPKQGYNISFRLLNKKIAYGDVNLSRVEKNILGKLIKKTEIESILFLLMQYNIDYNDDVYIVNVKTKNGAVSPKNLFTITVPAKNKEQAVSIARKLFLNKDIGNVQYPDLQVLVFKREDEGKYEALFLDSG